MYTGLGNPVDPEECRITQDLFDSCSGVSRAGYGGIFDSLKPPLPHNGNRFSGTISISTPCFDNSSLTSRAVVENFDP